MNNVFSMKWEGMLDSILLIFFLLLMQTLETLLE